MVQLNAPRAPLTVLALTLVACGGGETMSEGSATAQTSIASESESGTTGASESASSETGTTGGDTSTQPTSSSTGAPETTGESSTTGGDTSTTGGEAFACADVPLSEADELDPGEHPLGGFVIAVDGEGRILATPSGEPEHPVFSAPAAASMIEAAIVDLTIEEHQGSFDIGSSLLQRCAEPTLTRILRGGDPLQVLAIEGRFGDDDPACKALTYTLRLCEEEAGELAFELTTDDPAFNRLTLRTASLADERIFGMGEQFPHDTLDLKGRVIPVLAQEGGIGRGHGVISPAVNAYSEGSAGSEASSYYAAPHYLTSGMRSLYLRDEEYAEFDFSEPLAEELRLYAPRMRGTILHGDSPLELIERFTRYAGRMPGLPAWTGGGAIVALARPLDESAAIIADLQGHGALIAGVWNQTWSGVSKTFIGEQVLWNWVQNPNDHPEWASFVADLDAQGIRTLCYVNSMFRDVPPESEPLPRDLYDEALAADYFVHDPEGDPYLLTVTAFDVGLLDLANEAARAWMKAVLVDEMIDNAGCSGWMADFAEALPLDAQMADGDNGERWHNRYPVEWIRLNREAIDEAGLGDEILIFNRSGHTRTPRHAMLLWAGDQLTTWDKYDGLVSALHGVLSGGFSGIALNHSDTGGYTSLSWLGLGYDREAEQLKRWTEMNAFTALLRTHEGNQPGLNAQVYSDDAAMEHFARFTRVYSALAFYREQLYVDARERGWPLVRHLWLHYPDDPLAATIDDQFLLGSELLIAPIKNKCFTWPICPYSKELYLPAGEWVHLWSGDVYGEADAGTTIEVAAPIGEPAVFYRRGSTIAAELVDNLLDLGIDAAPPP